MSNELIKASSYADNAALGKVFAESGMFADVKSAAQAIVKIQAGAEMGIPPFASMTGIHIIQGKPTVGANLLAARVKGSGKYNYVVKEHTEKVCSLDFLESDVLIGNSTFTLEDAKKAGTKNLDKYPKNMLFARAMSNGVKWFTPDLFSAPIYVEGEIAEQVTEDIPHTELWQATAEHQAEAEALIASSTLNDNDRIIAKNALANCQNQPQWDALIIRLRKVQTPAA